MRNLLLIFVFSLTASAYAQEPSAAPTTPAAPQTPAPAPGQDALDRARLASILQQLNARVANFDAPSASDSDALPVYSASREQERPAVAPAWGQDAFNRGDHGQPGAFRPVRPGVGFQINDQLRERFGIDTGPVVVGVRNKSVTFTIPLQRDH